MRRSSGLPPHEFQACASWGQWRAAERARLRHPEPRGQAIPMEDVPPAAAGADDYLLPAAEVVEADRAAGGVAALHVIPEPVLLEEDRLEALRHAAGVGQQVVPVQDGLQHRPDGVRQKAGEADHVEDQEKPGLPLQVCAALFCAEGKVERHERPKQPED